LKTIMKADREKMVQVRRRAGAGMVFFGELRRQDKKRPSRR